MGEAGLTQYWGHLLHRVGTRDEAGGSGAAVLSQEAEAMRDALLPSLALAAAHSGDVEALQALEEPVSCFRPGPAAAPGPAGRVLAPTAEWLLPGLT